MVLCLPAASPRGGARPSRGGIASERRRSGTPENACRTTSCMRMLLLAQASSSQNLELIRFVHTMPCQTDATCMRNRHARHRQALNKLMCKNSASIAVHADTFLLLESLVS